MNNSCLASIPEYKKLQEALVKAKINSQKNVAKATSMKDKMNAGLLHIDKVTKSDVYKKFTTSFKSKCPTQYANNQKILKQRVEMFKKLEKKTKNPKLKLGFKMLIKVSEKLKM